MCMMYYTMFCQSHLKDVSIVCKSQHDYTNVLKEKHIPSVTFY